MPQNIKLTAPLVGFALAAARKGDTAPVERRGFYCDSDGDALIQRLEGLSSVLSLLTEPAGPKLSSIENALVLIDSIGDATVFINELDVVLSVRPKRAIRAGETVFGEDIADIVALEFSNIKVPRDMAVMFYFTIGWRRGFFFDLVQISKPAGEPREYNLESALAQCWAYVQFQDLFKIGDVEFQRMSAEKWFPFIYLTGATLRQMLTHAKSDWPIDDLMPTIVSEVSAKIPQWLTDWKASEVFLEHNALLSHAAQRFLDGDYVSATAILYPRIEGVLRSFHKTTGNAKSAKAKNLVDNAIPAAAGHLSLLMPARFHSYVTDVYFAEFKPEMAQPPLSRHSVAHGVARPEDFSQKAAVIGLLTLAQLFFYLNPLREPSIPVKT